LRLFKLKPEGQTIYRKPHCKDTKLKCVVPENIHTPTMEGILCKPPPLLLPGISIFFEHKNDLPTPPEFPQVVCAPPYFLEENSFGKRK